MHMQSLYQMGMRKVLVVGTGPLGCYPAVRLLQSNTTLCRDEVNSLSAQYNAAVSDRLRRAAAGSSELRYSFFDQYAVLQRYQQEPEANGKKAGRRLGSAHIIFNESNKTLRYVTLSVA